MCLGRGVLPLRSVPYQLTFTEFAFCRRTIVSSDVCRRVPIGWSQNRVTGIRCRKRGPGSRHIFKMNFSLIFRIAKHLFQRLQVFRVLIRVYNHLQESEIMRRNTASCNAVLLLHRFNEAKDLRISQLLSSSAAFASS